MDTSYISIDGVQGESQLQEPDAVIGAFVEALPATGAWCLAHRRLRIGTAVPQAIPMGEYIPRLAVQRHPLKLDAATQATSAATALNLHLVKQA